MYTVLLLTKIFVRYIIIIIVIGVERRVHINFVYER